MSDKFDDMEKEFEKEAKSQVEILNEQLDEVKRENADLKKTLWQYGIEEVSEVTDEEYICIAQIERLRQTAERVDLTEQEVRMFDLLNKNLRMIRNGIERKTPKGKKLSKGELLKIVDGGKADE